MYTGKRVYNSEVQVCAMRQRYPQFKARKRSRYDIEFIGDLVVRPNFPTYTVSVNYLGSASPVVKVLKPDLVETPPHFYKHNRSLCLYHPRDYQWTRENLIADNIIPWTAAWIYFYEVWLRDKEWYGPEADHSNPLTS